MYIYKHWKLGWFRVSFYKLGKKFTIRFEKRCIDGYEIFIIKLFIFNGLHNL